MWSPPLRNPGCGEVQIRGRTVTHAANTLERTEAADIALVKMSSRRLIRVGLPDPKAEWPWGDSRDKARVYWLQAHILRSWLLPHSLCLCFLIRKKWR